MKKIYRNMLMALAAVFSLTAVSCSIEEQDVPVGGVSSVAVKINGVIPEFEYYGDEDTRMSLSNNTSLTWDDGDKVYVYEKGAYVGELTASKVGDGRVASLSGSLDLSESDSLTLIYSNGIIPKAGFPEIDENGKIAIDVCDLNLKKVGKFVAYATIANPKEEAISGITAIFSFATSVLKVFATADEAFTKTGASAVLEGVSTVCVLTVGDNGAVTVSGEENGTVRGEIKVGKQGLLTVEFPVAVTADARASRVFATMGSNTYTADVGFPGGIGKGAFYKTGFALEKTDEDSPDPGYHNPYVKTISTVNGGSHEAALLFDGGPWWSTCDLDEPSDPASYGDYYAWGAVEKQYSSVDYSKIIPIDSWDWPAAFTFLETPPEGEVEGKVKYPRWDSQFGFEGGYNGENVPYALYNNSSWIVEYTKYNYYEYDHPENNEKLASCDDVASVRWGSDWRMPAYEEFKGLVTDCVWMWTEDYKGDGSGLKGYVIYRAKKDEDKGKLQDANGVWVKYGVINEWGECGYIKNGASEAAGYDINGDANIFMRASGYGEGTALKGLYRDENNDIVGRYWSNTLGSYSSAAYCLDINSVVYHPSTNPEHPEWEYCSDLLTVMSRGKGCSIRPVYTGKVAAIPVRKVTLGIAQKNIVPGASFKLDYNVTPANASDREVIFTSDSPEYAAVDPESGIVTGISDGIATITATSVSDGSKTASCVVRVRDVEKKIDGQDVVLLWDDGPYWATYNLGAKDPSVAAVSGDNWLKDWYGDYYEWGKTGTLYDAVKYEKTVNGVSVAFTGLPADGFSWENYRLCEADGSNDILAEKCFIDPDRYMRLPASGECDAARQCLGGSWRMPHVMEISALPNCPYEWTDSYNGSGVGGYIFYRSKGEGASYSPSNDVHIFMPSAGRALGSTTHDPFGNYWADGAGNWQAVLGQAFILHFYRYKMAEGVMKDYVFQACVERCSGCTIRPVSD